jgi:hypothetical protein
MENFLKYLLKASLLFSIMACASLPKQQFQYNLIGQVFEQKYNTMPQAGTSSKKGSPLATMIYIFTPTKVQQLENLNGAYCSQINSSFITSFVSDSLGYYRSKLNIGKYSVFVKYDDKYYIPYFSGAEWAAIFEVKENEKTELNIIVNSLTNNQ